MWNDNEIGVWKGAQGKEEILSEDNGMLFKNYTDAC